MGDIDVPGANVAKSSLHGPEAKLHILQIAAAETCAKRTNGIETGTFDIQAETDAVGQIDRDPRVR
jgi:hypothetical protein